MAKANQFSREANEMDDDFYGDEMTLHKSWTRKATWQRVKKLECKTHQTGLKKASVKKKKICMKETSKSQSDIQEKIRQLLIHRNNKITNEITCGFMTQQTAARRTCRHVVWVLL